MKAGLRNTEAEEGHSRAGGHFYRRQKQENSLKTTGLNIHVGADKGSLLWQRVWKFCTALDLIL